MKSILHASSVIVLCLTGSGLSIAPLNAADGKLGLTVLDAATQEPIPCRMHLKDPAGKAVQAPGLPFFHDHFVFPGKVTLTLPPGTYTFEIERGPEYVNVDGNV